MSQYAEILVTSENRFVHTWPSCLLLSAIRKLTCCARCVTDRCCNAHIQYNSNGENHCVGGFWNIHLPKTCFVQVKTKVLELMRLGDQFTARHFSVALPRWVFFLPVLLHRYRVATAPRTAGVGISLAVTSRPLCCSAPQRVLASDTSCCNSVRRLRWLQSLETATV